MHMYDVIAQNYTFCASYNETACWGNFATFTLICAQMWKTPALAIIGAAWFLKWKIVNKVQDDFQLGNDMVVEL